MGFLNYAPKGVGITTGIFIIMVAIIGISVILLTGGRAYGDTSAATSTNEIHKLNVTGQEQQPSAIQPLAQSCTSNWECSIWSVCSSFGTQTRTCSDKNNCGVMDGKPVELQSCTLQTFEPQPITLSGTGQEASSQFKLEKGLSMFNMKHDGSSNFAIWLMDASGRRVDLLVNEIGPFNGSKAIGITNGGDYILDISADGNWEVIIQQPRPTTASYIPKTLAGVGQKSTEFFYLNGGLTIFKMKHDGVSNFAIWLLDNKGSHVELLVNEIGSFDGSKAVGITKSGIYLLDISADGNWQVSIE